MKTLDSQIKFIDIQLLPLFEINGIIDYEKVIYVSNPNKNNINITKFNELITEFKEVFHAKNFSLHKTNYKIETKNQAVCVLKKCLEVASVPFSIFFKSKEKCMRLIPENKILINYIKTKEMSENRTYGEKSEFQTNEIYQDEMAEDVSDEELLALYNKKKCIRSISKEDINDNIKKTYNHEITIPCHDLLRSENFNDCLEIDFKSYDLQNKNYSSIELDLCFKSYNDVSMMKFTENIMEEMYYMITCGGGCIIESKFYNNKNLLFSNNVILLSQYLAYHSVQIRLCKISKIQHILKYLEIKIKCKCVTFYNTLHDKLKLDSTMTEQLIYDEYSKKYNVIRTMSGMSGIIYAEYFPTQQFYKFLNTNTNTNNNKKTNNTYAPIIKKKSDIYDEEIIKGNAIKINNIDGFNITNANELAPIKTISMYDYDFATWEQHSEMLSDSLFYYKQNKKNKIIHTYSINLSPNMCDTISDLNIIIPKLSEIKEQLQSVTFHTHTGYTGFSRNLFEQKDSTFSANWAIVNDMLKFNLDNKHINIIGMTYKLTLTFVNECYDRQISDNYIVLFMRKFMWNYKYRKALATSTYDGLIDINKIDINS